MKKIFLIFSLCLYAPWAFAGICEDITQSFDQRIQNLQRDTDAALSQATDPAEIDAIRMSFQIQLDQLLMEKETTLMSAGCHDTTPPPPVPDDPPVDDNPPGEDGPPPVDDDPTDPAPDPDDDDQTSNSGNDCPTNDCRAQLEPYADELRAQGICGRDFVHKLKTKARELGCNYGSWRSGEKGAINKRAKKRDKRQNNRARKKHASQRACRR